MSTLPDPGTSFRERIDRIRSIDPSRVIPVVERHRHSIKDLSAGAVMSHEGKVYLVRGVSVYTETNDDFSKEKDCSWYELTLINVTTGEQAFIEWEEDDDVVIYLTRRALSFRDLRDENGERIDEDDLDQIVDDEDSVFYEGKEFEYDDDYAAHYRRGTSAGREKKGDKAYFYEFLGPKGDAITIEEWKDGKNDYSYELFFSTKVKALTIIALAPSKG